MSTTIIRPDAFNSLSLLYHVDRKSSTVFLLFKSSLSNPFLFFFSFYHFYQQCPASEVESWILKATSAGLVDCRIDQLSNQVVVTRCTDRVFDKQAWTGLSTQLGNWINILDNLKTLL